MSTVTLDLAKAHMKVDGTDEDELIQLYIDAAEQWTGNYVGKQLADLDPVPADLKLAVLQLIAFRYDQRNAVSFGISVSLTPYSVMSALNSYRDEWFHDGN